MNDANNETKLKEQKITSIICVAEDIKIQIKNTDIVIHTYNLQDTYDCNISLYFEEICSLIHRENIVLVNCAAGIVIAYLMKYHKINLRDSLIYVRNKRNNSGEHDLNLLES